MITALGGGTIRDVFLDSRPPATFLDWRYLAVAAIGGVIAFFAGSHLERSNGTINILDATGLSLFAVTGDSPAPAGWLLHDWKAGWLLGDACPASSP
jgi:uncharacterized membrane protein YeiH